MKHLNKLLVAVLMAAGLSSQAQDSNNPWAITIGANAVDSRSSASRDGLNWFDQHFSQPFAVKDNWNILPSVSYIKVDRHIKGGFSFGLAGSVNKIDKFVNFNPSAKNADSRGMSVTNPGDLMFYGIDGTVKYSFMDLIGTKWFDPSLQAGGGYTFLGKDSFGHVNLGAGVTFWFTENVGLALSSGYRMALPNDERNDGLNPEKPSLVQHTAGIVFKFGGKDTDGDGIYDKDDACPEVAGLKQFNGCPDTDGDGIVDGSDACPDVAGLAAFNGCPDTDGDGIADKDDACPDVAGPASTRGCPDTDGDGLADKDDKCPTVAGPKENQGCPIPVVLDADKDGVPDAEDACPLVPGPKENKGCPYLNKETLEKVKLEARSVFFVTGKAELQSADKGETSKRLDAIKEILKDYPNAKWSIEGHTDNVGKKASNKKLSEARAKTVMDALIARGLKAENLTSKGFGDSKPAASNKTAKGKAENRRTEIIYVGGADQN